MMEGFAPSREGEPPGEPDAKMARTEPRRPGHVEGSTVPLLELVRGGEVAGGSVQALFNLSDRTARLPEGLDGRASVLLRSEAEAYGGGRREAGPADELAPFEFIILGPPSWRAFPDR